MQAILSNPTVIAAMGALFGVLLTLTGQALTGRRERQHERINKLFDTKLELYKELVETLEFSTQAWATTTKTAVALKEELNELQQVAELNSELQAFVDENSDGEGKLKATLSAHVRETGRRLSDRYKELAPLRKNIEDRAKEGGQAKKDQIEEFLSARDRLLALRSRIELVAEERLLSEFALVLQKLLLGVEVKSLELNGIKNSARSELGLRDRIIIGWYFKLRRKVALLRYKWKVRKEESLQGVLNLDDKGNERTDTGSR